MRKLVRRGGVAVIIAAAVGTATVGVVHADTPAEVICQGSGRVCVFKNINRNGSVSSGVWAYTTTATSYDLATSGITFSYSTGSYWKTNASSATNYRSTRERLFSSTDYLGTETCLDAFGDFTNTLPSDRLHSMAAGVGTTC